MSLPTPPSHELKDIINRKNAAENSIYGMPDMATELPLEVQNAITPNQDILLADSKPLRIDLPKPKAGFFATIGHEALANNELFSGFNAASEAIEHRNHLDDTVPDGWTSYQDESLYEGVNQNYWNYLRDATSPNEQQARREHVLKLQERDEFYDNGKWMAHFLGGAGGVITSPTSWFLPIASTLKYAKAGTGILKNMMRVAPSLTLQSAAHETWMESTKLDGNLENVAVDTMRDVAFGVALTGVASGFGAAMRGGKLWGTRKAVNLAYDGIDTKLEVNSEGIATGRYKASPLPGSIQNAQQLTQAQMFLDSRMAADGLFGLAFVGGAVTKVASALSPVVRGLTHDFKTVNDFTNKFADHSIIVEAMKNTAEQEGKALPQNFEREMWKVNNSVRAMTDQLEGYRAEANGLEPKGTPEEGKKSLMEAVKNGQTYNKEDFGRAVGMTIITGESHANKAINSAATAVSKHLDTVYRSYLRAHGLDETILSPRNAVNYLMQSWDKDAILQRPEEFIDFVSEQLKIQDEMIAEHLAPIQEAQSFLDQLLEHKVSDEAIDKSLANEIKEARGNLKRAENELDAKIRDNPDLHALLEKRTLLNEQNKNQLIALLKPRDELAAEISKLESDIKKQKKSAKSAERLAKSTPKTSSKKSAVKEKIEAEKPLAMQEAILGKMKAELSDLIERLEEQARNGEINASFFKRHPETRAIEFVDPFERPKFRGVHASDLHRNKMAASLRETIMNTNEEAITQHLLAGISGGAHVNPLKTRAILIPQEQILKNNFLNNDIAMNVANYTVALGRKTAFRSTFGDEGIEGLGYRLAQENREKSDEIIRTLSGDKQKKALIKLDKDLKSAQDFIKTAYDLAMGVTGRTQKQRAMAKGIRDLQVSTKLGAIILTQITDIGGIIFKNGIGSVLADGLLPAITTINGMIKNGHGKAYKEGAAHLNIALEQVGGAYSDKMWNSSTIKDPAIGGKIANGLSGLAHLSSNMSGSNLADNLMQRVAQSTAQSKFIKMLKKYKAGKLSERESLQLLKYGIDPKEWADRMLAAFEESGAEGNGFGGYHSKYYDWTDLDAKIKFGDGLLSAVRDSVIKKGLLDAPFWTNDPMWGVFSLFHGWTFSAFTRYTVPMMQRMDTDKAMGIATMLMLGALVDPMRKAMRGEEINTDKEHIIMGSITNGGVFGILAEIAQIANKFTDSEFLGNSYSDKYAKRDKVGSLVGPFGGYLSDFGNALAQLGSGKWNQNDMKSTSRLIPLANLAYLQYLNNLLIEHLHLPKNRRQASGWLGG